MKKSEKIFKELCRARFEVANADAIYELTGGVSAYDATDIEKLEIAYLKALEEES